MAKFKVPLKFDILPIEAQVTPRTKKQRIVPQAAAAAAPKDSE